MQIPIDEIQAQLVKFIQQVDAAPCNKDFKFIIDGQIHRYRTSEDKRSQTSGAYCIWADGWPSGWIQDWRNGKAIHWSFKKEKIRDGDFKSSLTNERIKQLEEISKKHQAEMQKQQESLHAGASERARDIFEQLRPVDVTHPYLRNKGVKSYGLRVNSENNLAVPLKDIDGRFISIQWINPDGDKKFFPGASTKGAFFSVALDILKQKSEAKKPILLGEGYATMATIYEITGCPCVAAMYCGNLFDVAKALKSKYPNNKS